MDCHKEYTAVASKLSAQPLLSTDEFYYNKPQTPKGYRTHLLWVTHTIYLTAITGILAFFLFESSSASALDCTRQENIWCQLLNARHCYHTNSRIAPALSAILPYKSLYFNGTLDYPSPFRGTPNPTLDAAWETLVKKESSMRFGLQT